MVKHCLAILGLSLCVGATAQTTLGKIAFPTSGSPPAQEHFIRGMLFLHNFEYEDAREEFQAASKVQSDFAMAYWGEALTHTYTLWMAQDVDAGRAALRKLARTAAERLQRAPTDREKAYIAAADALYAQGEKPARDRAYADAMGRLKEKYPEDLEAASLYALALLGASEGHRDFATYMQAAAVAEEVFARNPQHPGAIHYLIHAYDDPVHAPLGLRPAQVYAKVAGSASHAQHMPSHIFFALGMWEDAISGNQLSIRVADDRIKRKGLGAEGRNYHSLLWLEYAYLQEGRYGEAKQVMTDIDGSGFKQPLPRMRAMFAVETGQCDLPPATFDGQKIPFMAGMPLLSAGGICAARAGKVQDARKAYESAKTFLNPSHANEHTDTHHASPAEDILLQKVSRILLKQLEAEIMIAEGKTNSGLDLLAQTAADEDAMTFEFGPPLILKPTHELYGEELARAGRPKDAVKEFQLALLRAPKRAVCLQDLARAQAGSGDNAAAADTLAQLNKFWRGQPVVLNTEISKASH